MGDVKWTDAQALAIEHSGSDLIISAAAGSGKSATLTERIIRKIKAGGDISKMLIVTFTKAATAELKNKICNALSKALAENPANKHIQEQIIRVGSADICTIDSFCMRLVKPNFDKISINDKVKLDADFRIGEASEIKVLEKETMSEIIDELYESEVKDKDFLLVVDCYSNIWNDEKLGDALLKLRGKLLSTAEGLDILLKFEDYSGDFFDSAYGLVLKKHIYEAFDYLLPIYESAIRDFNIDKKGGAYIELFEREYKYLIELKRAFDNKMSYNEIKPLVHNIDFPRISSAKLADGSIPLSFYKEARGILKDFANELMDEFFNSSEEGIKSSLKQNAVICRAIYNILKRFEDALFEKKCRFSIYSFNDIASFALSLLYNSNGEITPLANDIASKYSEIYVDEYQDTNSIQDKLFKAISRNNRFMVGDIKQSIYGFRSAEPEIFSYYRTHFDKKDSFNKDSLGLSVFMSNNFRCDKWIIELSNLVSNYMFLNSYGVPYESSDELIYSKDLPSTYRHREVEACLIDTTGLGRGNGPKYEAEYVAKRIKHMIDSEYLPNGEKIKPSHIAILLRNYKSNHQLYTTALEKYGISSRYEVSEDFYEKPHILLVCCILNAVDNPSRDIYLAGAMRSSVFGFTLDELVKIKKKSERSASLYSSLLNYNKDESLRQKLDDFLMKLNEMKEATRKMTAYEAISYIFGRCGIISMCNSEQKADLIKLYNTAREYEANSFKGLYSFLKHIEKLIESKGDKSFRGDTAKENVKIMTVHSSKGLEFEVCFVCNLEDSINGSDERDDILFQRQLGIAGYVGKENGLAKFETMARKCIALQISRDTREEEMRVLYVAMTRARSHLLLVCATGEPTKKINTLSEGKSYIKPFRLYNASSLFDFVSGGICETHPSFLTVPVDTSTLSIEDDIVVKDTSYSRENVDKYKDILDKRINFKYKYDYLERLPSKMSISKLYPEILDGNNDDIEIQPLKDMPRFLDEKNEKVLASERGTATHTFMQFCDFNKLILENGVQNELERLVSCAYISLRDSEILNTSHLEMFAKSDLIKDILKAKRVIREFRFNVMLDASEFSKNENLQNEKVLVQGVTDCIYENEQGELILVDYKTDNVTLDNYEGVLRERHTTQLTYYKKACELMFERPVSKVLIYSVPLAKAVEL